MEQKNEIRENVARIRETMAEAARSCGRDPQEIKLCAATKMNDAARVKEAVAAGVDCCGENRVQELVEKQPQGAYEGVPVHFIGHLQTNKVKYLVGKITLFHSCDRDELAEEIARLSLKRNVVSQILVQVNIGREETKGGYAPENAFEAYRKLKETAGLKVRGFMAMLPDSDDEKLLGALADEMRSLYERAKADDPEIACLSLGMSGDYKLCIEHGSNMIRVGSTIFGARKYM